MTSINISGLDINIITVIVVVIGWTIGTQLLSRIVDLFFNRLTCTTEYMTRAEFRAIKDELYTIRGIMLVMARKIDISEENIQKLAGSG